MREPGDAVRIGERANHGQWPWRKMRPWPAGAQCSEADSEGNAQIHSQDDAPLCFRHFEGYYSSGRPGAWISGWFENFLEGQCASRARLRITQCKRFT
jgi:hypothetical protein